MKPSQSSFKIPSSKNNSFADLKPRITVVGVGGAGGNAVNNMIRSKLEGVDFTVCNTDAQALGQSLAEQRIQLGLGATRGLGAGSRPEVGRIAAEEALEDVIEYMKGSNMLFITAGMGGGTGTGAAPVLARAAREMGILTVGVVTKPFHFEGAQRMRIAEKGLEELQQYVDTLIVIPNQNLFRIANEKTTFADAFKLADDVLYSGVRGVTDLMIMPGLINLDFADVRSVMSEMGKAMMGTGEATGDRRAIEAAEAAISNPLLDDVSMRGARGVLINITGGFDMTLFEVDEAANRIREEVDADAQIIFGSTFDERLAGTMRVSVVATGIDAQGSTYYGQTSPQLHQTLQEGGSILGSKPADKKNSMFMAGMNPAAGPLPTAHNLASGKPEATLPQHEEHLEQAAAHDQHESAATPSPAAEVHDQSDSNHEQNLGQKTHSLGTSKRSGPIPYPGALQEPLRAQKKPGFFERLTGFTFSRISDDQDEDHRESDAIYQRESKATQPNLPGIGQQEQASEDENLEIPAFLRRGNKNQS